MEINVDQHMKSKYRQLYSRTSRMTKLQQKSNYGESGHYAFEISSETILEPFDWEKKQNYEKASLLWIYQ